MKKRLIIFGISASVLAFVLFRPHGIFGSESIIASIWQDLNWLGTRDPSAPPSISTFFRALCATPPLELVLFLGLCIWTYYSWGMVVQEAYELYHKK